MYIFFYFGILNNYLLIFWIIGFLNFIFKYKLNKSKYYILYNNLIEIAEIIYNY